jgi:hypothetical protein
MVGCRTLELEHFRFFIVFIEMESSMNQKHMVASLLEKASKYREFARWIGDRETVQQILALAGELKQRALALAKPNEEKIRKRAREI